MLTMDVLPDMPDVSPPVVLIAQANNTKVLKLGMCMGVATVDNNSGTPSDVPAFVIAADYLSRIRGKEIEVPGYDLVKFIVVKPPQHGQLFLETPVATPFGPRYGYLGEAGYVGKDQFTLRFVVDGQTIEATVFVHNVVGDDAAMKACKRALGVWPLSENTVPDNLEVWGYETRLSTLLASATRSVTGFTDLPGLSTGQTVNYQITLDSNAAGHGWYIDPTPLDNTDDD